MKLLQDFFGLKNEGMDIQDIIIDYFPDIYGTL